MNKKPTETFERSESYTLLFFVGYAFNRVIIWSDKVECLTTRGRDMVEIENPLLPYGDGLYAFNLWMGRKILDIDADEDITLDSTHFDTDPVMFGVHDLHGDEVFVETQEHVVNAVTTTSTIPVSVATATTTTIDGLTLAQTLIEIKAAKPKVIGVMIQEPSETKTTTTTPVESKPSQDNDKTKITKAEKPLKKKDQIMYD
ncbi:hypothetical protein Tco_0565273 [Tanacetum coccineum]